jgi:hypothetical protein
MRVTKWAITDGKGRGLTPRDAEGKAVWTRDQSRWEFHATFDAVKAVAQKIIARNQALGKKQMIVAQPVALLPEDDRADRFERDMLDNRRDV